MIKAMLLKQWREMISFLFRSGKKGKRRSRLGIVGYAVLMVYLIAVLAAMFFQMAQTLCVPLVSSGMAWLYFALVGMLASAFGIVGSVFTTQAQLYEAKDNEFLLSLPIPPWLILLCRMISLYLQTFFFEALVMVPAGVVYGLEYGVTVGTGVAFVLVILLLPLLALALACVLGWIVTLVSSRIRNKSLITVVLSLALLAAYYYVFLQMNAYLQRILENSAAIGGWIQRVMFPFYQMALALQSDMRALLLFAVITVCLFALVYAFLSAGFLKMTTTKRGFAKVRYRRREAKVRSPRRALLGKEFMRFFSSPTYMLNCALGTALLAAAAVFAWIRREWIASFLLVVPQANDWLAPAICAGVCFVAAMNVITAPSISLEGRGFWILRSLPVSAWQVLGSKLKMHLLLTLPMVLLCTGVLAVVCSLQWASALLALLCTAVYTLLCAALGLLFNLRLPNFNWTNETVAVKRSGSVVIAMFTNLGILITLSLLYVFVGMGTMNGQTYLLLVTAVLSAAAGLLVWVLRARGEKMLERI